MKLPGHPISIAPARKRVRVTFAGKAIADSTRALAMEEAGHPLIFYIPRADVDMTALQPSEHRSHCPCKGDASYCRIVVDGNKAENADWSYEQPFPAMAAIAGHLAFYRKEVAAIAQEPA